MLFLRPFQTAHPRYTYFSITPQEIKMNKNSLFLQKTAILSLKM